MRRRYQSKAEKELERQLKITMAKWFIPVTIILFGILCVLVAIGVPIVNSINKETNGLNYLEYNELENTTRIIFASITTLGVIILIIFGLIYIAKHKKNHKVQKVAFILGFSSVVIVPIFLFFFANHTNAIEIYENSTIDFPAFVYEESLYYTDVKNNKFYSYENNIKHSLSLSQKFKNYKFLPFTNNGIVYCYTGPEYCPSDCKEIDLKTQKIKTITVEEYERKYNVSNEKIRYYVQDKCYIINDIQKNNSCESGLCSVNDKGELKLVSAQFAGCKIISSDTENLYIISPDNKVVYQYNVKSNKIIREKAQNTIIDIACREKNTYAIIILAEEPYHEEGFCLFDKDTLTFTFVFDGRDISFENYFYEFGGNNIIYEEPISDSIYVYNFEKGHSYEIFDFDTPQIYDKKFTAKMTIDIVEKTVYSIKYNDKQETFDRKSFREETIR